MKPYYLTLLLLVLSLIGVSSQEGRSTPVNLKRELERRISTEKKSLSDPNLQRTVARDIVDGLAMQTLRAYLSTLEESVGDPVFGGGTDEVLVAAIAERALKEKNLPLCIILFESWMPSRERVFGSPVEYSFTEVFGTESFGLLFSIYELETFTENRNRIYQALSRAFSGNDELSNKTRNLSEAESVQVLKDFWEKNSNSLSLAQDFMKYKSTAIISPAERSKTVRGERIGMFTKDVSGE